MFIAERCEDGKTCKGKGKALCIVGYNGKQVCPQCLIAMPDFDIKGKLDDKRRRDKQ